MAKKKRKRKSNKSEAIRQYLTENPEAPAADVIAALKAKRMVVTPNNVSTIRWNMKKAEAGKEAQAADTATEAAAAPVRKRAGRKSAARKGSKSQAVRDFVIQNPEVGPTAASAMLKAQGINVSPTHFSNIKSSMKSKGTRPAARARRQATGEADHVSVSALFAAKQLAEKLGGLEQARQAIATLAQLAQSGQ